MDTFVVLGGISNDSDADSDAMMEQNNWTERGDKLMLTWDPNWDHIDPRSDPKSTCTLGWNRC